VDAGLSDERGASPEPAMHRLTVARTARYATVGASPAEATQLWVAFHGYGHRAADFVTPFVDVVPAHVRVVAPEGLSRFYLEMPRPDGGHLARTGASWLTRDDREDELHDALAMVQAVVAREHAAIVAARGERPAVCVLGFSQGVAMSMRWVVEAGRNPALGATAQVARHVLWAGGLAHDVPDDALHRAWSAARVELVWGSRDRFASDAAREVVRTRFEAIGVTPDLRAFEGGHRLDAPLLGAMLRESATDRP
jgi:predicted esterase